MGALEQYLRLKNKRLRLEEDAQILHGFTRHTKMLCQNSVKVFFVFQPFFIIL